MLIELIAGSLLLPPRFIARFAGNASHRYKHFTIPKARGGERHIYHPAKPLKAVQRWLQAEIVTPLPVHVAATAYRKRRNIADHANMHINGRYLLRVDLADFFHSITADDIDRYIADNLGHFPPGWTRDDTELFIQLVCLEDRLTIGAVTSPGLSNALCYPLDEALAAHCAGEITYTRYADDLFFSTRVPNVLGDVPAVVEATLAAIPYPRSLRINAAKTRHSSMKRRRRVTGIVLSTQGRISLGRHFKRGIRSQIHRMDGLDPAGRARLAGLLAYVKDIEPAFFNRLVLKYGDRVSIAARPPK